METMDRVAELERRREELVREISQIGEMRRGTLRKRYRRCGRPGCHCMRPGAKGHGPVWSLTWAVGGKTQTRVIAEGLVERTRRQIAEYKRFRELTQELIRVSEELCDALMVEEAEAKATAKKRGSK